MKKPEKKLNPNNYCEHYEGYNQACEDWERYHKDTIAELLDALKKVLGADVVKDDWTKGEGCIFDEAQQVIAKAEGDNNG